MQRCEFRAYHWLSGIVGYHREPVGICRLTFFLWGPLGTLGWTLLHPGLPGSWQVCLLLFSSTALFLWLASVLMSDGFSDSSIIFSQLRRCLSCFILSLFQGLKPQSSPMMIAEQSQWDFGFPPSFPRLGLESFCSEFSSSLLELSMPSSLPCIIVEISDLS